MEWRPSSNGVIDARSSARSLDLDPAGAWRTEAVRELRGCGYTINKW
jgi:hypothetical protein